MENTPKRYTKEEALAEAQKVKKEAPYIDPDQRFIEVDTANPEDKGTPQEGPTGFDYETGHSIVERKALRRKKYEQLGESGRLVLGLLDFLEKPNVAGGIVRVEKKGDAFILDDLEGHQKDVTMEQLETLVTDGILDPALSEDVALEGEEPRFQDRMLSWQETAEVLNPKEESAYPAIRDFRFWVPKFG